MVTKQDGVIGRAMLAEAIRLLPATGFGGVAILRLDNGQFLNSSWGAPAFETTPQCAETGAIYEAIKLKARVTHSLCVFSRDNDLGYEILSPCGICQDRLRRWGEVLCAISSKSDAVFFRTIEELDPYFWGERHAPKYASDDLDIGQAMLKRVVRKFHQVFAHYSDPKWGAAVIRLSDGRLLLSVRKEPVFESLAHGYAEGALIQAEEYNRSVTHLICIRGSENDAGYEIVSPDGDCKEKLYRWGNRVKCAISTQDNSLHFLSLKELTPYYWRVRH